MFSTHDTKRSLNPATCALQQDSADDDDGVYDDVDALYDETLLEILNNIDVKLDIQPTAPAQPEPGEKGKKANRADREAERAKSEAERAKEREKATIAATRAQIAARGCASRHAAMSRSCLHAPRVPVWLPTTGH